MNVSSNNFLSRYLISTVMQLQLFFMLILLKNPFVTFTVSVGELKLMALNENVPSAMLSVKLMALKVKLALLAIYVTEVELFTYVACALDTAPMFNGPE